VGAHAFSLSPLQLWHASLQCELEVLRTWRVRGVAGRSVAALQSLVDVATLCGCSAAVDVVAAELCDVALDMLAAARAQRAFAGASGGKSFVVDAAGFAPALHVGADLDLQSYLALVFQLVREHASALCRATWCRVAAIMLQLHRYAVVTCHKARASVRIADTSLSVHCVTLAVLIPPVTATVLPRCCSDTDTSATAPAAVTLTDAAVTLPLLVLLQRRRHGLWVPVPGAPAAADVGAGVRSRAAGRCQAQPAHRHRSWRAITPAPRLGDHFRVEPVAAVCRRRAAVDRRASPERALAGCARVEVGHARCDFR
jgi:hypothetical protein